MAVLQFPPFAPDVASLNGGSSQRIINVIPQADGYGPFPSITPFTQALPALCRGGFVARGTDSSVAVFAGTSTNLYLLDNTDLSWTEVSKGGSDYPELSEDAQWRFAQFNTFVIAVQKNAPPQVYDLAASSAFADLGGTPPQAGYVSIVNRFVLLADLLDDPFDIAWSDVNDPAQWTTGSSDQQTMATGGRVLAVEPLTQNVALIWNNQVRRMTFVPGSSEVFQIEVLREDIGLLAPYSVTTANGQAWFVSQRGFVQMDTSGSVNFIGAEKVDRTFLGLAPGSAADLTQTAYSVGDPQLVLAASDNKRNIILWMYRSQQGQADVFDRGLVYHYGLARWSPVNMLGEYVAQVARPGLTLEGLDAIAPGALVITGLANNGSGLIRVTVADTSTLTTGDIRTVSGVIGSFADDANGTWTLTVISGTTFDLQSSSFDSQNVTGAANNGAGLIRLAMASTAAWTTGSKVVVASVTGTTEANGNWVVTVIDATHLDLQGSTFTNAYVSGGTVKDRYDSATDGGVLAGDIDLLPFSLDDVSTAALPALAIFNTDHKLGLLTGDSLEAQLETAEQRLEGRRYNINGLWPRTDADSFFGSVATRDNLNIAASYGDESEMDDDGYCPLLNEGRNATGVGRIPAGATWSYITGIELDVKQAGRW